MQGILKAVEKFWMVLLFFGLVLSCGKHKVIREESGNKIPWSSPPNILWLVAEDLSPYIPAYGDSTIVTPNLDRLAAEGVTYTNVFSPSPVCAPSRFAIATGIYPSRGGGHHMRTGPWYRYWTDEELEQRGNPGAARPKGLPDYEAVPPPEVRMHGEYLRKAGYYCTNNAKEDYQFRRSPTVWDENGREAHWKNRKPGQPFFAIFNFEVTHESRIWRKQEDSLWVDPDLPVSVPPYLPDNKIGQQDVRRMYSNILEMDHQVGAVLLELEETGELENTVIFWYSDHGGPLPRQKRLVYDSGIKLPLIVRYPNKWQAGTRDHQLVSFLDFKPTILSLAGISVPDYVDGRSFIEPLSKRPPHKYVHAAADRFDEKYDMVRAVHDSRFKYIKNFMPEKSYYLAVSYREQMSVMKELLRLRELDSLNDFQKQWFRETKPKEELFDCLNDPHELHNLANDGAYHEKLVELREECDRWMEEIHDLGLIDESEMLASWWPGGTQPITLNPEVVVEHNQIHLSSETPGASIGYQILNKMDTIAAVWQTYGDPLEMPQTGRIAVIAHRIGYRRSEVKIVDL